MVLQKLHASQVCNGCSVAVHLVREVAKDRAIVESLVQQRDIGSVPLNIPCIVCDCSLVDHLFVLKG